jgi:hypothetical protein
MSLYQNKSKTKEKQKKKFEPTIAPGEPPKTHALDHADSGIPGATLLVHLFVHCVLLSL